MRAATVEGGLWRNGTSVAVSTVEAGIPMSINRENGGHRSPTSRLVDSVDQMVRLPFEVTGATWDLFRQGMQSMTGERSGSGVGSSRESSVVSGDEGRSGSGWTRSDQDLSGEDLKYVVWSIAFTKPGFECVLEPQREEIVNYSADGASFAAVKIAKLLDRARHGRVAKPEEWGEDYPPVASKAAGRRTEVVVTTHAESRTAADAGAATTAAPGDRGWRIPAEDQKYIRFLYRVDRRLPKQESETTRVTVERGGTTKII